jgi:hypothetical protein
MSLSIWTDEAATYWIIKDGLGTAVDRALRFQGQSPLYFALLWLSSRTLGTAEWALRMPSAVMLTLTLVVFYRLGKLWFDRQTALFACMVLACHSAVYALQARPYALALLAETGAWYFLVRWIKRHSTWDACAYVLFAALTFYAHYVFAITCVVQLAFAWSSLRRLGAMRWTALGAMAAGIVALTSPGILQLHSLFLRRASLSFMPVPTQVELATALLPLRFVDIAAVVLVLCMLLRIRLGYVWPPGRVGALWAAVWHVFPVLALFGISRIGGAVVFVERYYLCGAPGLALLAAWVLRGLQPVDLRAWVAVVYVGLSLARPALDPGDWKGLASDVRSLVHDERTPILLPPTLIEAKQVAWLNDPEKRQYLQGPLAYYRVPGDLVPLPVGLADDDREYLATLIRERLAPSESFIWVSGADLSAQSVWLEERLAALPFEQAKSRSGPSFMIHSFHRTHPDTTGHRQTREAPLR